MCHMSKPERVRLVAYVDAELAAVVDSAAAALGQSRSSLVSEVLGNAGPVLVVLRDMALDLKQAPERHREYLAHLADVLRPMADEATTGLESIETYVAGPPPSNTGVRK